MDQYHQFVVADAHDAPALSNATNPLMTWSGFYSEHLDLMKVNALLKILISHGESDETPNLTLLTNSDDSGFVAAFSESMLTLLADARKRPDLDEVIAEWHLTHAIQTEGLALRESRRMIHALLDLAESARSQDKTVLVKK